jgi:hypothetical protein
MLHPVEVATRRAKQLVERLPDVEDPILLGERWSYSGSAAEWLLWHRPANSSNESFPELVFWAFTLGFGPQSVEDLAIASLMSRATLDVVAHRLYLPSEVLDLETRRMRNQAATWGRVVKDFEEGTWDSWRRRGRPPAPGWLKCVPWKALDTQTLSK